MRFLSRFCSCIRFYPVPFLKTATSLHKKNRRAFTFVEVMVTLTILSAGIIVIFKSLFYSLDQIHAMSSRLYADMLLESRSGEVERLLRVYNALPLELNRAQTIDTGNKKIDFKEQMSFEDVEGLIDVFRMDLSVSWKEGSRDMKLSRSSYLLDVYRAWHQK